MGYTGHSDEGFYDPFDSLYTRWLNDNSFKPGHNPKDLRIMLFNKGLCGDSPMDQVTSSSGDYRGARLSPTNSGRSHHHEVPDQESGTYSIEGSISLELAGRCFCMMATFEERAGNLDKDRAKDGNLGTPLARKTADGTNSSGTIKSRAVRLLKKS